MRFSIALFWLIFVFADLPAQPAVQPSGWQPSPGHTQIPIWPGVPPDAQAPRGPAIAAWVDGHLVAGKRWTYVAPVSRPTMTVMI